MDFDLWMPQIYEKKCLFVKKYNINVTVFQNRRIEINKFTSYNTVPNVFNIVFFLFL